MKMFLKLISFSLLLFSVSCQKGTSSESDRLSAVVSSNVFYPPAPNAPQATVIAQLAADTKFKALVAQGTLTIASIQSAPDTATARTLAVNQMSPKAEAVRLDWGTYLAARSDRNAIVIGAIDANGINSLPASGVGPCEDQRARAARICARELVVSVGLCTIFATGGPFTYAACVGTAGTLGWLCGYEADVAYNDCRSRPATLGQQRWGWVYNRGVWIWTGGGCTLCP